MLARGCLARGRDQGWAGGLPRSLLEMLRKGYVSIADVLRQGVVLWTMARGCRIPGGGCRLNGKCRWGRQGRHKAPDRGKPYPPLRIHVQAEVWPLQIHVQRSEEHTSELQSHS